MVVGGRRIHTEVYMDGVTYLGYVIPVPQKHMENR